jgi:hypothetical protein
VLAYYHADSNEMDKFVQLEYLEIRTSFALDKEANSSTRYIDFLRSSGNRKHIFIITALALFSQVVQQQPRFVLIQHHYDMCQHNQPRRPAWYQHQIAVFWFSSCLCALVFDRFSRTQTTLHLGHSWNAYYFCRIDNSQCTIHNRRGHARTWKGGRGHDIFLQFLL